MMHLGPAALYGVENSFAILALVLVADAVLAGFPGIREVLAAPAGVLTGIAGWFDRRLNRARRSDRSLRMRGGVVAVMLLIAGVTVGLVIAEFSRKLPMGWLIEAFFVASVLLQRRIFDQARVVARELVMHGLDAGRGALSRLVNYDTSDIDDHTVARGAAEALAVRFCEGVVSPAFWYLIFGLPGLFASRAIAIMVDHVGGAGPDHAAFGAWAVRFNNVANAIPAPLAGMILSLAALFVPKASSPRAFSTMLRDARAHPRASAGWTEAAMAGALGLALSGPRRYDGEKVQGPWIGDGRARALPQDVRRAAFLFAIACVIAVGLVAGLAVLSVAR